MSASTVSVTANPRRRPSAVSDLKQSIDIANDATNSPNFDNSDKNVVGDGDDDKVTSGNKDLSHSIRGEAGLERSKDKKSSQLPNSNAPIRARNRKAAATPQRHPRPRWQTVFSILTKNFLLLLVLVGLVQMVKKLVMNSGNVGGSGNLMGFSDMEGRIAGMESSVKTTTKMLQVQVEILDEKIGSEIANLRREINRRLEDGSGKVVADLMRLEDRIGSLERGLAELNSKELWTKDDVVKLYEELKRGENGGNFGFSFDEIRGVARDIVEKEIEKHAADGLARADYALASAGAYVMWHSDPLVAGKASWFTGNSKNKVYTEANKMLQPSFGEPGQCFALKGSSGQVIIRLRTAIVPEAITLEHVAESVAYDRSSAPKHCRAAGLLLGHQGLDNIPAEKAFLLADFTYDLEKSNAQTFNVLEKIRSSVIDTVVFEFSSNHGSLTHTCIYRLRVHGHEPKSVPVIPADS